MTVIPGELLEQLLADVFGDKPPTWSSQDAWGGKSNTPESVRYVRLAWDKPPANLLRQMRKLVIKLRLRTGCGWVVLAYAARPTMEQEVVTYQRLAEKWST